MDYSHSYNTDIYTFEDNNKMIHDFGELFNKRTDAKKWIDKINLGGRGPRGSIGIPATRVDICYNP